MSVPHSTSKSVYADARYRQNSSVPADRYRVVPLASMGEFVADEDGTVMAAPSSTDSPHSSPSSSIIPPVSSTFLYNSMMSATHSVSPQPPCLLNEEEELEEEDMCPSYRSGETRKAREFIPESKKDEKYWERRRKNNEAAKRSREKRRQNDALMEQEIAELKHQNEALMRDNAALLREVAALKARHKVDAADPVALAQPTPPPPPPLAPTLNTLDLLALQRLLSALASNNGTGVLDQGKTRAGGGLDESPLDLSGGKPSLLQHQCLVQPSPPNPTLPVEEMEQSELQFGLCPDHIEIAPPVRVFNSDDLGLLLRCTVERKAYLL
ncbi:unnamed protein product [Mesocestoides corti]|uniref:BZIP domain-containing protein n=1 Tax=Mesocestoides corti TaxID=53468 RepID=A0A0R3UEF0_MESCO|nr:unnamed protein product [Mesocestoides corti]